MINALTNNLIEIDYLQQIAKYLATIKHTCKNIEKYTKPGALQFENTFNIDEPFENLVDFEEFDAKIADLEEGQKLITILCRLGGKDTKAKLMLKRVMSNKLMAFYNMAGINRVEKKVPERKKKLAFKETNFFKTVLSATMAVLMDKTNENEIGKAVAAVLVAAPDRSGGGGRD
ncbi:uncharacterized protein [Clytia hemisphaerica]|uniref:uncharacterized protein n=1 Tax=Clytia hemisphaerica TaxID=252671 RepID=UPI0034D4353A